MSETSKPRRLERRPVPGLQAHLVRPALEPVGEVVVGDDEARRGERLVVLAAALAQHRRRSPARGSGRRARPTGARAARRAARAPRGSRAGCRSTGARGSSRRRRRRAAARSAPAVGRRAQAALVEAAALVLVEVALRPTSSASPSAERPSANGLWSTTVASGSRVVERVGEDHRHAAGAQPPAALGERQRAGQRLDRRHGQARGEAAVRACARAGTRAPRRGPRRARSRSHAAPGGSSPVELERAVRAPARVVGRPPRPRARPAPRRARRA